MSFMGHAGFYKRFIKDFSKLARPLTTLLCKNIGFEFDEECLKSFTLIKEALASVPIVQAPNWDHPSEIMCDASEFCSGSCPWAENRQEVACHLLCKHNFG